VACEGGFSACRAAQTLFRQGESGKPLVRLPGAIGFGWTGKGDIPILPAGPEVEDHFALLLDRVFSREKRTPLIWCAAIPEGGSRAPSICLICQIWQINRRNETGVTRVLRPISDAPGERRFRSPRIRARTYSRTPPGAVRPARADDRAGTASRNQLPARGGRGPPPSGRRPVESLDIPLPGSAPDNRFAIHPVARSGQSARVVQNAAEGRGIGACWFRSAAAVGSVGARRYRLLTGMRRLPTSKILCTLLTPACPQISRFSSRPKGLDKEQIRFRIHVAQGECGYESD
jgi:hypothetical protein